MKTLAQHMRDERQRAADEFNAIKERELSAFVDKHGGKLPGETLEQAVLRCRVYDDMIQELRKVSARVPPIPVKRTA